MDDLDHSLMKMRKVLARRILGPRDLQQLGKDLQAPQPQRAYSVVRHRLRATAAGKDSEPEPRLPAQRCPQRMPSSALRWRLTAALAVAILAVALLLLLW